MTVPFGDPLRQYNAMQPEIDAAASNFFRSGSYMLGLHVQAFEREWARAVGGAHGVGVGNGTDALLLALRAAGVGPGDEVITVPNAAGYTAFALRIIGACPVYADVDPQRWTLDPADVVHRITPRTK
ncbi:MAG: DegT/DnrJ/EryC1/StrS aminotransferase family protein, partial [Herpetosiphonaceae bacterium]|nr:DegT/DnrJ/EryC1/StrS aminotransferase family protein [Herpetosiphonaceae bacterium]